MGGYAPGWQVRCRKCGLIVDAGKAGIIRIGAAGKSYKLGWCSLCRRIRWLVVERVSVPDSGDPPEGTSEQGEEGGSGDPPCYCAVRP